MASTSLDYASRHIAGRRRFPWKKSFLAFGALLFACCAIMIEVSTADTRIDAVTGTMLRQTSWPFGITSGARVEVSPLEARLKQGGIPWTADWRYMNSHGQNIFGITLYRGCSSPRQFFSFGPCSASSPPVRRMKSCVSSFA